MAEKSKVYFTDWHHYHEHFKNSNPNVAWRETLEPGEKIGRAFDSFKVTHISERRYTPSFFCQFLNLYLHVTYRYCILEGEKYHS